MTLKEAVERGPIDSPKPITSWGDPSYHRKYEDRFLQGGMEIIDAARMPIKLQELAEVMRPDHPDVAIHEWRPDINNGVVVGGISWSEAQEKVRYSYDHINYIGVFARVATKELVFARSDGVEVLQEQEWSDPMLVEDALVRGYHKPFVVLKQAIDRR